MKETDTYYLDTNIYAHNPDGEGETKKKEEERERNVVDCTASVPIELLIVRIGRGTG